MTAEWVELQWEVVRSAVAWRGDVIPKTSSSGYRAHKRLVDAVDAWLQHIADLPDQADETTITGHGVTTAELRTQVHQQRENP